MKSRFSFFAFIFLFVTYNSYAVPVSVEISPITTPQGTIFLALYQLPPAQSWQQQPQQKFSIPIDKNTPSTLVFSIGELEAGHYAIRLFQDENNNQLLDRDSNGFPTEPFAFSGAVEMGIPNIEQAMITVNADDTHAIFVLPLKQVKAASVNPK